MKQIKVSPIEFKSNIQPLLLMEGIKFTTNVVKGMILLSVPFFFVEKYGF